MPDLTQRVYDGQITRVILEHAARIGREQDISVLIGLNAALARDLVGGDRSTIWLIDESTDELWTRVADGLGEVRIPRSVGLVGACIQQNEIIVANDPESDPRFHRQMDRLSGYHTSCLLCVPLHSDGKVIGVLQVLNKEGGFSRQDAEMLRLMSVYAASAIQNERLRQEAEAARLFLHELHIAREVQESLLPRELAPLPGIEYTGFCRSAKFVGGDYYDLIPLADGSFAFTLGDVSGKGVPAAVLMASIQTLLRSLLMRSSRDVAEVVHELNDAVHHSSTEDRYSTLFCAVLNPERSRMRFVNAGHVPPLIVRTDGSVERPTAGSIPVGFLRGVRYFEQTQALTKGDLVVCVSDGITEACRAHDSLWGERNIRQIILDYRSAPIEEITSALVRAADRWAGHAEQHDDMTVVAVRII